MRVEDVRLIVTKEVQNYGKIVFTKHFAENGWLGMMHPQHSLFEFTFDNDQYCQLRKRAILL